RAAEPYNLLEAEFEKVIRKAVRRGTVQVHLRCQRRFAPQDFQINTVALRSYLNQLHAVAQELNLSNSGQALLGQVLALPGVAPEPANSGFNLEAEWPVVEGVLEQAIGKLQSMRREEGEAMARELLSLRNHIGTELAQIRTRAPQVSVAFRDRLLERVR